MGPLPLPTQTLTWLTQAEQAGQYDAQVMVHLLNRADANDQDVAKFLNHYSSFLGSYSKNIAAFCRRLEALERKVNLRKQDEDVEGAQFSSVADTSQRITDYAAQAGLTVEDWAKAFNDAPEQRQATPAPAPETPAEALAVRPLLERVAQLGDAIGRQTVAQVQQLANQAAVWLRENPPGQLVAIEPRGCPTPGACSCVEPTPPAPVPVAWCRSDEFANSMNRGGSFNGWKDPGAGANKCDMQLYAIPLPAPVPVTECPHCGYEGEMVPVTQAGDVEA